MSVLRGRISLQPFHGWLAFLTILMVGGVIAAGMVFVKGLQVTNLTDLVPWGLWITIDLSSIALSAGAFTLCAAVYILGLKRFQPVARTATFIGLIGYSMAMMCLLLDIGRPDRFWHGFVYWNTHSVLWEVTMCVGLYFMVLVMETMPIIGESDIMRQRAPRIAPKLSRIHHYAPILAIIGLGLSMLHQSSLGATYGVLKSRPIWYRPDLSVLFMISAIVGGISLTVLASMVAARLAPKVKVNDDILERLSLVVGWALVGYLYFRFWDAFAMTYTYQPGRTEGLQLLTKGSLAFNFWVGEIILGAVIPIIILLNKRFRSQPGLRALALGLVVGGVVAYRWDVNLAGQLILLTYLPADITARFTTYFPSLIEFAVGAGIVAFGFFAFTMGVRYLNIVHHPAVELEESVEVEPITASGD
jgi:Ni/Fe-hydrogenase subunit HybB-like protein